MANGLFPEALQRPGGVPVLQVLADSLLPLGPLLLGAHRCPSENFALILDDHDQRSELITKASQNMGLISQSAKTEKPLQH